MRSKQFPFSFSFGGGPPVDLPKRPKKNNNEGGIFFKPLRQQQQQQQQKAKKQKAKSQKKETKSMGHHRTGVDGGGGVERKESTEIIGPFQLASEQLALSLSIHFQVAIDSPST